jgi:hypothetical protein
MALVLEVSQDPEKEPFACPGFETILVYYALFKAQGVWVAG